jgi:dihydroneopterin aldolase
MSDEIRIIGIHSYGYHGVFEHEQKIGQDFYVDIHLHLDLLNAAKSDSLSDTVDYSSVCEIVIAEISGPPVYLLLAKFPQLKMVAVTVHKPQAPVSAEFLDISVTIERTR